MKILFVCTGNVFRSMSAEKCLKHYLKQNNISHIQVDSAGTAADVQEPHPSIIERLQFHGIPIKHKNKKLTKELIENNDLIVAMGADHLEFIKKEFGVKVFLFNEIAYNKKEGILDFHEVNPSMKNLAKELKNEEIKKYAYYTVDYILDSIPYFVNNISAYCKQ